MIHIAIVEDTKKDAEEIEGFIQQYGNEHGEALKSTVFSNPIVFLTDYQPVYDIVLLDIQMPHMDGLEAAARLRELDSAVPLVFITNMQNYAVRGYSVNALDFVVKPVAYMSFANMLTKAIRIAKSRMEVIILKSGGKSVKIPLDAIYYLEAEGHQIIYHTEQGEYAIWGTLREQEDRLPEDRFARTSRYCIVNLKNIQEFEPNAIIIGGAEITVTRLQKKEFTDALLKYYGKYL